MLNIICTKQYNVEIQCIEGPSALRVVLTQTIFFEINVGKSRIRHTIFLKLNDEFLDRLKIDCRFNFRVVPCRIRLFPTLISKIKWVGSGLPLKFRIPLSSRVGLFLIGGISFLLLKHFLETRLVPVYELIPAMDCNHKFSKYSRSVNSRGVLHVPSSSFRKLQSVSRLRKNRKIYTVFLCHHFH